MKCSLCRQRKGKRFCPALRETICPQCCGEKRVLEIDCPESCEYLRNGLSNEVRQERTRHLPADPAKQEKYFRIAANFEDVLTELQTLIGLERRASRNLEDRHVAEALDRLIQTLGTESRGVLYESRSSDLTADALRRQLDSIIQSYRLPVNEGRQDVRVRLRLEDAIDALQFLRDIVGSHMESVSGSQSFVNFLARRVREKPEESPSPSIIIPGR